MDVVVFESAQRYFAASALHVQEVLPLVPVTPLPFLPPHVQGLIAHAGEVVPQIGLATLLGLEESTEADGALMVLQAHGFRYALRIARIVAMAAIDDETIHFNQGAPAHDPEAPAASPLADDRVAGEFRWREQTVILLNTERLGLTGVMPEGLPDGEGEVIGLDEVSAETEQGREGRDLACLLVSAGGERYALRLELVLEVVEKAEVTPLPYAPREVAGILYLRDTPFLAFSLPELLNVSPRHQEAHPAQPLVIILYRGVKIGLLVERVVGIERFPETAIHPVSVDEGQMEAYLHDRHQAFFGLLDMRSLIPDALWSRSLPSLPKERSRQQDLEPADQTLPFLAMMSGDEYCVLPLGVVERVVAYHPYDRLPENANPVLDGVVQLHGEVLPVADLRKRFLSQRPVDAHTAYVVTRAGEHGWAMAVDQVFRLVEIPGRAIDTIARGQNDYIGAIGRLNGRIYSVLTIEPLRHSA